MVVDILGLDEGRLRRYSETEGVNNVSIGSGLAWLNNAWMTTTRGFSLNYEGVKSLETEKLEEKSWRSKYPDESFLTFTCTDWRLSSNFAVTRWITDIAATGI